MKNKNSIKLTILLILTLLIFTSCDFSGRSSTVGNYHTGLKGLTLEFVEGAPPTKLYVEEGFEVHAMLKNEGAYNLNGSQKAKINLVYDPVPFYSVKLNQEEIYQSLDGKSLYYPEGDYLEFSLATLITANMFGNFERRTTDFYVNICYPYQTTFAEQVCIDTNFDGQNLRTQVCSAETMSFSEGQGAPIAVTQITPRMIPFNNYIQPQYTIEVQNLGGGLVFQPFMRMEGKNEVCDAKAKLNVINLDVELQGEKLVCTPQNITLRGGKGEVTCRFASNSITMTSSNFYSTLKIDLMYNYENSYSKKIEIQRKEDLNFANLAAQANLCQAWEVKSGDTCISLCEYCANNPSDSLCDAPEVAKDKTKVRSDFKCIYSYKDCTNANPHTLFSGFTENVNNCILRERLCPPETYCGTPLCKLDENQYAPKVYIGDLTSNSVDKISWYGVDDNDQVTTQRTGWFTYGNKYPDMERTCGLEVNSNSKPVSYYKFINSTKECPIETSEYTQVETSYADGGIYPPIFEANIPLEGDKPYEKVCIKVVDKLGKEEIRKFTIKKTQVNTKLV